MQLAGLQFDIVWEDKQANFAKVRKLVKEAGLERNALLALPEMFATGFSMNTDKVAEEYGGETEKFLAALSKEFGIFVAGGAAMRGRKGQARNKALIFSPDGELIAFYAKMKPFTLGGERSHYEAGKNPIVFEWQGSKVAPFVCYDLRFPEIFRDIAATDRPEVFIIIANWPDKRAHHWVALLQARAIENQAYVLGVNRAGKDPYYTYAGRSLIVDPDGKILVDAGSEERCIQGQIDLPQLRKYRAGLPFLDDLSKP